jgi:hypothetical protein
MDTSPIETEGDGVNPSRIDGGVVNPSSRSTILTVLLSWLAGLFLFAGTAAVVWWQNTRLTVLYDLSGVLEPAMRMAQGDRPYLDFPFPYAPLTFLTQAELIRLTGTVYWHHIAYCCIIAGLGSVLAWRILVRLFLERLPRPRLTAFILSLPMIPLGVYCIFPHPFYDPDAAFILLLCIFLLLWLERRAFPSIPTFLLGILLVLPLFIKQNIGLAFLCSCMVAFLVLLFYGVWRKAPVRPYLLLIGGIVVGLGIGYLIVEQTVGFDNYKYWTLTFAAARRTPPISEMLAVYADWLLLLWSALFIAGAMLVRKHIEDSKWPQIIGTGLMAVPFLWPVVYLLIDPDASERAERLVGLWPMVFISSIVLAYFLLRKLQGIAAVLPFILIATAHGVFLSQQLWGSTYAIWPLLIILIGIILTLLYDPDGNRNAEVILVVAATISVSVTIAGAFYIYSNERLDYVDFEDGDMAHSTLPQLQGMSMKGDFLPDFEELVKYTNENIPPNDGILNLPGEDLFYYATGRHPHFPVLLFDVTNNPYIAAEISDRVLASDIEWVIVKNDTQIEEDSMIDSKDAIFELLKPSFRNVESLNNYEVYKRRHADDPPEDEEDDSGDDGDTDSE